MPRSIGAERDNNAGAIGPEVNFAVMPFGLMATVGEGCAGDVEK
jgi:hypothetical protein